MSRSTERKVFARSNSINYFNFKARIQTTPKETMNLVPLRPKRASIQPAKKPVQTTKRLQSMFSKRHREQSTPQSSTRVNSERDSKHIDLLDKLIEQHSAHSAELVVIKHVFEQSTKQEDLQLKARLLKEENSKLKQKIKALHEELYGNANNNADQGNTRHFERSKTITPSFKLNLKINEKCNFQDEFMSNADHFSDSWRLAIKQQKLI